MANRIAGLKAAYTRKINKLDEQVGTGQLTKQQAAGHKSVARKKLNQQLSEASV